MDRLPGRNGRPCSYRVVHVSGTIRKIEEVAIRRAKLLVIAAKQEMAGQSSDALSMLFGGRDKDQDLVMEDASDGIDDEEEDGQVTDG